MFQASLPLQDVYWFVSSQNNLELAVDQYGDGLALKSASEGWNIPNGNKFDSGVAIRPAANLDWNLNALGNGPYDTGNRVGVWSWAGGHDNETWFITEISSLPNPSEEKLFGVHGYLKYAMAVRPDDAPNQPILMLDLPTRMPQSTYRPLFSKIDWGKRGFALRSKYNGKYVYWNGGNQPLDMSDVMSLRTLWNAVGDWSGDVVSTAAVRPYLDGNQNLNAFGGREDLDNYGRTVGTWDWCGGQLNEKWAIVEQRYSPPGP